MKRYDIINYLIEKNSFKYYLEIGIDTGETFRNVNCLFKDDVDPEPKVDVKYRLTSDNFFANVKKIKSRDHKYDLIFIDGLHHSEQVIKDVNNSLDYLNDGGFIIIHDCNPPTYGHQTIPPTLNEWNGDVWKAFLHFRMTREDLEMFTIDTDWGCGVIKKGKQSLFKTNENIDYSLLDKNRKELLNLITIEDFKNKYN